MDISFANKKLEKIANNDKKCRRKLGDVRCDKFRQRLDDLSACNTLEDARFLPGHYHELKHDHKGQWACDLDQPYRLIFRPQENPIPQNDDGHYIWSEIKAVEILEIKDYH